MKIKYTVLNSNYSFYGLLTTGEASEFGFRGSERVERILSMEEIYTLLTNYGVNIVGISGVSKVGNSVQLSLASNVHLYDFPMLYAANNQTYQIANGIEIVEQYVSYNGPKRQDEVIGYGVVFEFDTQKRHVKQTPASLAALSTYFRPKNYLVKQLPSGEVTFAGKAGFSLKSLPIIRLDTKAVGKEANTNLGDGHSSANRMRNASTTNIQKGQTAANPTKVSFLEIASIIQQAGGKFVFLPETSGKYKAKTIDTSSVNETTFVSSDIEIAEPVINFSATTAKLNLSFKKLGRVLVSFNGSQIPVQCCMYATKSVFDLDSQHMRHFMVSCPAEKVEWLQNQLLARTMTFTEYKEMTIRGIVNSAIGQEAANNILLDIDTTYMKPIGDEEAKKFIREDIGDLIYKLNNMKVIDKWLDVKLANIESIVPGATKPSIRPEFLGYSQDMINNIKAYGIDPTTGIYTPSERPKSTSATRAGNEVKFDFSVAGYKAPTKGDMERLGTDVLKASNLAPFIQLAITTLDSMQEKLVSIDSRDVTEMSKWLRSCKASCSKNIKEITEKIWCYNQAALLFGNYRTYKDLKKYTPFLKSRVKEGKEYVVVGSMPELRFKIYKIDVDNSNIVSSTGM